MDIKKRDMPNLIKALEKTALLAELIDDQECCRFMGIQDIHADSLGGTVRVDIGYDFRSDTTA